jgi:hypothetical protein
MEKLIFKNHIVNIIIGGLLILFAILGYFLHWIEDALPIIISIVLISLSLKRFFFSFQKTVSKYATLVLIIEIVLDIIFAGLLIYFQDHIEVFIGLIIYTRGVSYLIINYVATRKIKLFQYILNIVFLTFGAFLMFANLNSLTFLTIFVTILILLVGAIFLQSGLVVLINKEKTHKLDEKTKKIHEEELKTEKKIEKLERKVKTISEEKKKIAEDKKELLNEKKQQPAKPKNEYELKTMAELKEIAKSLGLTGYSQFNKAELVDVIIKHKKQQKTTNS